MHIYYIKAISDDDLQHVVGGMFMPFINYSGTYGSNSHVTPISVESLLKSMGNGAMQAGFTAAVASKNPNVIATAAATGGLTAGLGHCVDNMKIPYGKSMTLESCLRIPGSIPKEM